jgi:RNA polymerase sigma factor (sigma-70 family)
MTPKPMLTSEVTPAELLAEVLALRPEIERILSDQPGCSNASSIEDRVQIVLLNIVRHLDTYEPHPDGPRPWVWRIARNVNFDARRARKSQIAAFGYERFNLHEVPSRDACPERRTRARQLLRKVIVVIAEMPRPLHTVLVLVALCGLELDEVATQLKIKYGNARTRLCRARDYLRERFGTLDEHLAVLAPVPVIDDAKPQSLPRRTLVLTGQFAHFWPPFLVGAMVLSQVEMPIASESATIEPSMIAFNGSISQTTLDRLAIVKLDDALPPRQTLLPKRSGDSPVKASSRIRIDVDPPRKTLRWHKTR